jgi:hypothetical protein
MKRVLFVLSVALLAGLSAQAQKTNAAPVKEKKTPHLFLQIFIFQII